MKKILFMALAAFTMLTVATSCKKKVSDADVTTAAQKVLTDAGMTGTTVSVAEGVVTLGGTCKDDKCKADCEELVKKVGGVKSIINNCMVTPPIPQPASITTTLDAATQQKVKDGIKDIAGVTVIFEADKAVFSGEITAANRMKLMQMLGAAKVKADVSKLTAKK